MVEVKNKTMNNPENGTVDILKFEKYIKENIVLANNKGAACPDGRYTQEQDSGWIRIFGAHLGVSMAIMASLVEKDKEFLVEDVYSKTKQALFSVFGKENKLQAHTDDHNEIGCGHMAQAALKKNEDLYGIKAEHSLELWEISRKDADVNWITLEGSHREKAILLIRGKDATVHSQNKDKTEMYFVVDIDRTNELLTRIGNILSMEDVTSEDIIRNYWKQVNATSTLLAKDLPQLDIILDKEGNSTIKFIGNVK